MTNPDREELIAEDAPPADTGMREALGKYAEVLVPFVSMMAAELRANSGKGDRPGWLQMDRKTGLLEIFYHLAKLQKATKNNDQDRIREYGADVANMAMMLVDICGALPNAALTAPGATTKSDGGDLPANLAEIIETELMAWRGINGGIYTIHAAALGISCAVRSAVFRASNTESDGGVEGHADLNNGRSSRASQVGRELEEAGFESGPSDPSSTRSEVTVEELADWLFANLRPDTEPRQDARALLDQFEIRRK